MPLEEPWVPLLVIDVPRRLWASPAVTLIAFVVIVAATGLLAFLGQIPWLPKGAPIFLVVVHPIFWKLVLAPLGVVLALVVARHFQSRTGHVEFFEDRIAFSKHEGAVE